MNNTRRPLDPRICPVAIDANALDRDGSARDNLVDRLLGLSSAGTINLIIPKRVREEIQNPRTPAHVQEAVLPKLFTIQVGLNSDEQRRKQRSDPGQRHRLIRGVGVEIFSKSRLIWNIPMSITELVVRQSTVDQISPISSLSLLHRPVFDRLVDWLGFVVADRTRWRPD